MGEEFWVTSTKHEEETLLKPTQEEDDEEEEKEMEEEERKRLEEEKQAELQKLQAEALVKQDKRKEALGELLRSKGFFWIATTNDIIGGWQQAGNVLRIRSESPWMCLMPQFWEGTKSEPLVRADMTRADGS